MRSQWFAFGLSCFACGASALSAGAQTVSPTETTLPEIVVTTNSQPVRRGPDSQSGTPAPVRENVVVTPTSRPEPVSQIAGTVQVIDRDMIEHSTAKSITDLLAENAVGFMSEWGSDQTSINIRGGATEGQGRDYKSEVLVLINGHRAGTANVSKLSFADVERIEIVRGPSSVVYGSQNMGGVINIIMKTGRTAPGSQVDVSGGSWSYLNGRGQTGGSKNGFDWYVGGAGSQRSDYQVGGGRNEQNTGWNRKGGSSSLGWQVNPDHRFDFNVRTDGVYDAGFRGSTSNIFAHDDRYNQSTDFTYNGQIPGGRLSWFWQAYGVHDIDNLNQPSPLSAVNSVATRTTVDDNRRQIDVVGQRFQPKVNLWEGNNLLTGLDWERSWIRSTRFRAGGPGVTQTSPQDNNQHENVYAFYLEDSQKSFDDRWTVRGGIRRTYGKTSLDATPFAPTLIPDTKDYQATTFSAGSSVVVLPWLTTRADASSGFRAPTATELGANFTTSPTTGSITYGNPSLRPESSEQLETGATASWNGARLDLALFQNTIYDRITTRARAGSTVISDTINNPGNIVLQGVELQSDADVLRWVSPRTKNWLWKVFANGYYNFKMLDEGADPRAGSNRAVRINQYELSIGTRFGQPGDGSAWSAWNIQIQGLLRGPMWYNTEEYLSPTYYPGQIRNTTIYQKDAFWVWNLRGETEIYKNIKLYGMIKNIFDANQHPIFIALDQIPCVEIQANQNGSCGNSIPGREFVLGMQARW
jgi:vitamin B12 transporter